MCGELFRFFCGAYGNAPAEHFGIGIRGFAEEGFVVRAYGEEGGIYARKLPAKAQNFISAEVDGYVHLRAEVIGDGLLDLLNIVIPFNHMLIIDSCARKYTPCFPILLHDTTEFFPHIGNALRIQ